MLQHRLLLRSGLLSVLALLAACDQLDIDQRNLDPVSSNYPAGTPGEFTVLFSRSPEVQVTGRIAADGTVTCNRPFPQYRTRISDCRFEVDVDEQGQWQLFSGRSYVVGAEGSYVLPQANAGGGLVTEDFDTRTGYVVSVEWRMDGYAPAASACLHDRPRSTFLTRTSAGERLSESQDYYVCSPVLAVSDSSNTLAVRSGPNALRLQRGQQRVLLHSDSDFPLDAQLLIRSPHVLGSLRADASCPIAGAEGGAAVQVSPTIVRDGRLVRQIDLDRNLLSEDEVEFAEVFLRIEGNFALGEAGIRVVGHTLATMLEMTVLPGNQTVLGDGVWWRVLRLPGSTPLLMTTAADRVPAPRGFCEAHLIRALHVTSDPSSANLRTGDSVDLIVRFDQPVDALMAGRSATLRLETGATDRIAEAIPSLDPHELRFRYTVQAGDRSERLEVFSRHALQVRDGAEAVEPTQGIDLRLPAPGGTGSLGQTSNLVVEGAPS